MANEEDIYKEHPHLRECVAAIRAVAGPGEFFSHLEFGCAGWHWGAYTTEIAQARGYKDHCFIDLDRGGYDEPFRLFSLCGDGSAPDGPADGEQGNKPTPELAAACARWLMETPTVHETT